MNNIHLHDLQGCIAINEATEEAIDKASIHWSQISQQGENKEWRRSYSDDYLLWHDDIMILVFPLYQIPQNDDELMNDDDSLNDTW